MPEEKTRYHFDRFPSKPEIFGSDAAGVRRAASSALTRTRTGSS